MSETLSALKAVEKGRFQEVEIFAKQGEVTARESRWSEPNRRLQSGARLGGTRLRLSRLVLLLGHRANRAHKHHGPSRTGFHCSYRLQSPHRLGKLLPISKLRSWVRERRKLCWRVLSELSRRNFQALDFFRAPSTMAPAKPSY